jgi:hypothetical protein
LLLRVLIRIRKDPHNPNGSRIRISIKVKSRELSKAHYGAIEVHPGAIEGLGIPLGKDPDPLKNREPDPHQSEKSYPEPHQMKVTRIRTK